MISRNGRWRTDRSEVHHTIGKRKLLSTSCVAFVLSSVPSGPDSFRFLYFLSFPAQGQASFARWAKRGREEEPTNEWTGGLGIRLLHCPIGDGGTRRIMNTRLGTNTLWGVYLLLLFSLVFGRSEDKMAPKVRSWFRVIQFLIFPL
jgi:hypothetical protein